RYNLNILRVKGRSDLVLKLNVIKKIILTAIIIVSVQFGIYGILISQCVFAIISVFLNTMYSAKMINYSLRDQLLDVGGTYLLSCAMGLAIYFIDNSFFYHFPDLLRVCL